MVEAEEYSDQASEDSVWLLCPSPTAVVTPALLVTSAKPRIRVAQAVNNEAGPLILMVGQCSRFIGGSIV